MKLRNILASLLLAFSLFGLVACTRVDGTEEFTLTELAQFDGQDGQPAYVAVDGVVYDVSNADGWNNGSHQGMALAGTDATDIILSAPHGEAVLEDLPVVGTLISE